jgi:hypothetical protein
MTMSTNATPPTMIPISQRFSTGFGAVLGCTMRLDGRVVDVNGVSPNGSIAGFGAGALDAACGT